MAILLRHGLPRSREKLNPIFVSARSGTTSDSQALLGLCADSAKLTPSRIQIYPLESARIVESPEDSWSPRQAGTPHGYNASYPGDT